jgi:NADH:ubiquinone oxidoreductase subunit 4 (subunit M)
MKNRKSPERLAIEEKIKFFIYWSLSVLIMLLGLILTATYFRADVTRNEVLAAIRFQLAFFTTATLCCPVVPIPAWFPFPSQYRLFVITTGMVIVELMSYKLTN